MRKTKKILLFFLAFIVAIYFLSFFISFSSKNVETGLSFSEFYAKENLSLDWKKAYETILNDFHPKHLILMAYWPYLEPEKGVYDFNDLDWELNLASSSEVILVIGQRIPRWPECHLPSWTSALTKDEFNQALLNYLSVLVNHYKNNPAIKYWQVENEPYLSGFGVCPPLDKKLFQSEIALVKKLDPKRPIVVTDSGELGLWIPAALNSNVFGTTLYRMVGNKYLGMVSYFFIPPPFYTLKAFLVKAFTPSRFVFISELQAEPWAPPGKNLTDESFSDQTINFSSSTLWNNFLFAQKTGLNPIYLWGVEWWYYRKINGDESFWNVGKKIFSSY